ncbi:MAG: hypothetical protein EBX52_02055 [Proteobacteria bacterium]|nr:hypothetical protein [Pseudomonadota bacterium]
MGGRAEYPDALKALSASLETPDRIRLLRQNMRLEKLERTLRRIELMSFHREGPILKVWIPNGENISELSSVLLFLISERSPLLEGARMVVASLVSSDSERRYLKIRSLDGTDLNPLYPRLMAQGLEAGGRASAGTAAYGKAGLPLAEASYERTRRDLALAVQLSEHFLSNPEGPACDGLLVKK